MKIDGINVPMTHEEMITKEDALYALGAVKHVIWEEDIPSPTIPEYIELHEKMQRINQVVDEWSEFIVNMPEKILRCKDCRYFGENWRCNTWHQFSVPEWHCSRGEKNEDR